MKTRLTLFAIALVAQSPSISEAADYQCLMSCQNDTSRCVEEAQQCETDCRNEWERAMEQPLKQVMNRMLHPAGRAGVEEMMELNQQQGQLNREVNRCREACATMSRSCQSEGQRCASEC